MIVEGIEGLKTLAGIPSLIPSTVTISRILRAIGEKNAELDAESGRALRDLFVKTGEMTGDLRKVMNESLDDAFRNSSERCHVRIVEGLAAIDKLSSVDGDQKARVMETAIRENVAARRDEIRVFAEVGTVLAAGGAASLVVLAAAIGYKYARKPTFMESVQRILQSL